MNSELTVTAKRVNKKLASSRVKTSAKNKAKAKAKASSQAAVKKQESMANTQSIASYDEPVTKVQLEMQRVKSAKRSRAHKPELRQLHTISPYALVDPAAKIGRNVNIGAFTLIGANVEVGDDTWIGTHAVITGDTIIGRGNKIYQFASIGEDCQDKKYHGENSKLIIGDYNTFREGCTVHRGTEQGGWDTVIGNNNLFMVNTHVAHDCKIGNNVVFSNGASIAGHVSVADNANLGGLVGVHQFCAIGAYSFAAGGSIIYKDVLPFTKVSGYPAKVYGLNLVGLERLGFTPSSLEYLRKAYKIIFKTSDTVKDALATLKPMIAKDNHLQLLYDFLQNSTRGIVR